MKRLFLLIASSVVLVSCGQVATIRTSAGLVIEAPVTNVPVNAGQHVSLLTVKGDLYQILPRIEATGVKTIDTTELYVLQGTVIKVD
jgi:hypothetical protein